MTNTEYTIDDLLNWQWTSDERFYGCFLCIDEVARLKKITGDLFRANKISLHEKEVAKRSIDYGRNLFHTYLAESINQPRKDAQKFIAKKNIRRFIFNRDNNTCLKCGNGDKLSLDHIIPIKKGGLNRLYNLQTLCTPCNSSKGTKIIDYR